MIHNAMVDPHRSILFGTKIQQCWTDLRLWETFFKRYGKLKAIIELGTLDGGMSTFLFLHAIQWGMKFWTFDRDRYDGLDTPLARFLEINKCFVQEDVLQENPVNLLALLADEQNHPLVLFCDNGNKGQEFQKYVPLLKSDDYVAVHDWETEIYPEAVKPLDHLVEPVLWEECKALRSITRFWRRK